MVYKVGINARILTKDYTGIANYLILLLKHFRKYEEFHFILFLPGKCKGEKVTASNIEFREVNAVSCINTKLWELFCLPRLLKQEKIDLYWSPTHHLPFFLSRDIKTVLTIHDLVWKYAPQTMRMLNKISEKILMLRSVSRADKVICISTNTQKDLLELVPECLSKTVVINPIINHIDIDSAISCDRVSRYGDYILYVGTREPRKNLAVLVDAYNNLPETLQTKYQLVIAGGAGWKNDKLVERIKETDLQEKVKLTGYVDNETLNCLYSNASVFIFISTYEGFGLPILEAMSAGIPVITSNCSSMPEAANDAAILVDPSDVTKCSEAIQQLLENDETREEYRTRSLQRAQSYNNEGIARRYRKLLNDTLNA